MTIRYFQVDVFSDRPGGGNPLGVVLDAHGWDDQRMQSLARWTGLVETTFILPPEQPEASYRLRIFTPVKEIPFAGHPTLGSAHIALDAGLCTPVAERLVQQCGVGLLPIRVEHLAGQRLLLVRSPAARLLLSGPPVYEALGSVLNGLAPGRLAPVLIEGGRRWWLAEAANESALRQWRPDHAAIAALAQRSDSLGLCAYARAENAAYDLVVRAFPAGVGIVEDPASGAANGLLAAWLRQAEPQGPLAAGYRVSQGREIGHDARILIEFGTDDEVWVGGSCHTVVRGYVEWPAA